MKGILTRFNPIVGTAALVLLTLCLLQTPALACDHRDGPRFPSPCWVLGLAPGQTLRVNLGNLIESEGRGQHPVEVFARVHLSDAQGRVIAQSADVKIPLKQFRTFNFNRAALSFPGEPGTGRLQMLVEVEVRSADPYAFVRDGRATGLLPESLEIIDDSTGRTTVATNSLQIISGGKDSLIGIVPDQALRVTLFNPPSSHVGGGDGRTRRREREGLRRGRHADRAEPQSGHPAG